MDSTFDSDARIRALLDQHARLSRPAAGLGADADLYEAGMTSLATVNVMLALEGAFNIEFPDEMLKRSVFSTVAAIREAITRLGAV